MEVRQEPDDRPLIDLDDARRRVLELVGPTAVRTVPIQQAVGAVLASDVRTRVDQPPFAHSAMDGYAVRSHDLAQVPVRLRVVAVAAAGHPARKEKTSSRRGIRDRATRASAAEQRSLCPWSSPYYPQPATGVQSDRAALRAGREPFGPALAHFEAKPLRPKKTPAPFLYSDMAQPDTAAADYAARANPDLRTPPEPRKHARFETRRRIKHD